MNKQVGWGSDERILFFPVVMMIDLWHIVAKKGHLRQRGSKLI